MVDLKQVYQALTLGEAELKFVEFQEKWEKRYPLVIRSWEQNWVEFTTYFRYPEEISRLIHTTNVF